ncbi:MAG: hypothetical protein K6F46_05905 [Desulfovibrio sp.]|nr:hypothetical protein [Desulfovibrio sp.]
MACVIVGAEAALGRPIPLIFYHIPSAVVAAIKVSAQGKAENIYMHQVGLSIRFTF